MSFTEAYRNRRNTRVGAAGQQIAAAAIRRMGLVCVETIETGWRVAWAKGRVVGATPKGKVSGDIRAVMPGTGRSVLVEVKTLDDGILSWGDLEPHQHRALQEHQDAGGLSLVVLVVGAFAHIGCYGHLRMHGWSKGHPAKADDHRLWYDQNAQRFG